MLSKNQASLFIAASVVAVGGLIYELIIGTVSSYLLGNSTLHFSITIGLFLFGMGLGSFVSPRLRKNSTSLFIFNESLLGILGGNAVVILFALFAFSQPLFYVGFVLLVLLIGTLIGLEIPLLLRMLEGYRHSHQVLTKVLSLDYLGSLLASILFPLVLLPALGLLRTSLVVGFVNVVLAGLLYFFAERKKKASIVKGVLISLAAVILFVEIIAANYIASFFEYKLYQDEVVYIDQTQYQKIVLTKFKDDVRLFLDGNLQFSSLDEARYHESLVHIPISYAQQNFPQHVLILGGGDGLAARELLKYSTIQDMTLVDLDPEMVDLSKTHPLITSLNKGALKDSRLRIVHADAFSFVEKNNQLYDLIIIDLPDPNNENLSKLYSQEFYRLIHHSLSENGVMVSQATTPYFANNSYWLIADTIESVGFHIYPYHVQVPSFGEWGFVMATKFSVHTDSPRQIEVETTFLNRETLLSEFVFAKDLQRQHDEKRISTLFDPQILHTYEEEARRWQR